MRLQTIVFILALGISSCAKEDGVCLKSAGKDSEKTVLLNRFNSLEINDKIDVDIYLGTEAKAIVYSGENIIDGIGLDVDNNTLTIRDNNTCHWIRSLKKKPRVALYIDSLESITFYGAGNLVCHDTIPSTTLYLEAWEGSGDITYLTMSRDVYLKSHTGVSHFNVQGSCNYLFLYNNTYAQFRVEKLVSKEIHVASLGNGDIKVFATEKISINQTGHSIIEYNASVNELNIIEQSNGELIPY